MTATEKPARPKRRTIETWMTVGVVALPVGWVNSYRDSDGDDFHDACPALLLQELREIRICEDRDDGRAPLVEVSACEPPYETRVVFAAADGSGGLEPADDVSNHRASGWAPHLVPAGEELADD